MNFNAISEELLRLYRHQFEVCEPYRQWCELLGRVPAAVSDYRAIPFLPIEFFRTHRVYSSSCGEPELTFTSSGTTGADTSVHYVASAGRYEKAFMDGFKKFYGNPSQYSIFALLPNYLERSGSSLVYMVNHLHSFNPTKGGFFLNDLQLFHNALLEASSRGEKILIIGVTFALVDYARAHKIELPEGAIVMETGGMKGRGRAIEREELHELLSASFSVPVVHSEYGMTELLSQGYSQGEGLFSPIDSLAVVGRSLENPLDVCWEGDSSRVGLNIIDLANEDSCSFIATGDWGHAYSDGTFRIGGRIEGEILRGCNMLQNG